MLFGVGDQLSDAHLGTTATEETEGIIEANTINLEAIKPVDADVTDEFQDAFVLLVELLEEDVTADAREGANEGRVRGYLVEPEIRKAVVGVNSGPHVVEDAVHNYV